jgi:transcription antitermination factor NusG
MLLTTPYIWWYALHVYLRSEKTVARLLEKKGYEVYLPLFAPSDSEQEARREEPLFPGYLFCRMDAARALPVVTTPGVKHIVGYGARPVPIQEEQIIALRKMVASGFQLHPVSHLPVGQKVEIRRGPLRGICGVLHQIHSETRFVLTIDLLGRSVAVVLSADAVAPIATVTPPRPATVGGHQQ